MTLKLGSLKEWTRANKGNSIVLPGDKYRKIRLEVMTFIQTNFLLWRDAKLTDAFPLGNVDGHQIFEFWHDGEVVINADANVFYRSADGLETHVRLDDAVTFTKPAMRRARNYQQEWIEYQMFQNMNRRIAAVEADVRRKLERSGIDPDTGEVLTDGKRSGGDTGASKAPKKRAPDKADASEAKSDERPGGDGDNGSGDKSGKRVAGDGEPPAPANA